MEDQILNFKINFSYIKLHLLTIVVIWPYFGFFGEEYYRLSSIILIFSLFLFLDSKGRKLFSLTIAVTLLIFLIGQVIYGFQISALREILRIGILFIGAYLGLQNIYKLPYFFLVIFLGILVLVSKYFHPNIPIVSNIFASAPEMNDSYHYVRTIIPGGLAAISGYMIALISIWGFENYLQKRISFNKFILGHFILLVLIISTQSRLSIAFFFLLNIFMIFVTKVKLQFVFKFFISYLLACLIFYSFREIILNNLIIDWSGRFSSLWSFWWRIENYSYTFNLIYQELYRLFPGCLFNRGCHYDGTVRSISIDSGFLYVLLNWGLIFFCLFIISSILLITESIKKKKMSFTIFFTLVLIFSAFDPLFLDPKLGFLVSFTCGYYWSRSNLKGKK